MLEDDADALWEDLPPGSVEVQNQWLHAWHTGPQRRRLWTPSLYFSPVQANPGAKCRLACEVVKAWCLLLYMVQRGIAVGLGRHWRKTDTSASLPAMMLVG